MYDNNVHVADQSEFIPPPNGVHLIPTRNSVILNTTSTNSYLQEVFDTFGEDHIPGQAVQNVKVINDSRKYESTREVDGRLVLEALNP